MNRIDRLFAILVHLQSKKYVTAESISEKFEISLRTVYRDIKALTASGIPISYEVGRGYFIVSGFFLSPVAFSTEEASALLLMEKMVGAMADKATANQYSQAMTKIRSVIKGSQQDVLEVLDASTHLQFHEMLQMQQSFIPSIQNAIVDKKQLELSYKDKEGALSSRLVEPTCFIFYAFSWHLFAWCHLRKDYRDFKLNRLLSVKKTDLDFSIKDHKPISYFIEQLPVNY